MKEVLIIHGSRRKKNTYALLKQIETILEEKQVKVEVVSLYDYTIHDCVGCELCLTGGTCGQRDDVADLLERVQRADGIILSSPVYLRQVSGRMKSFIDRTCSWFHCPPLANKPVLAVSTTMGSGLKDTLSYLQSVAEQWGGMQAGTIGRNVRNMQAPVTSKEMKYFLELLEDPSQYRPSLSNMINFEVQKSLALCVLLQDKPYWEEKGWSNAPYYQPAKLNPFSRLLAASIGKMMRKGMSRK